MASIEDVARIASGLPEVTEDARHGNRTWFVAGKGFVWVRPFSRADLKRFGNVKPPEGPIIAVRVTSLEQKDVLLMAHPSSFFTIPHFDGYAAILIQLSTVTKRELREAIVDGWLACAPRGLTDKLSRHGTPG